MEMQIFLIIEKRVLLINTTIFVIVSTLFQFVYFRNSFSKKTFCFSKFLNHTRNFTGFLFELSVVTTK